MDSFKELPDNNVLDVVLGPTIQAPHPTQTSREHSSQGSYVISDMNQNLQDTQAQILSEHSSGSESSNMSYVISDLNQNLQKLQDTQTQILYQINDLNQNLNNILNGLQKDITQINRSQQVVKACYLQREAQAAEATEATEREGRGYATRLERS